jgi:hypothetical protein
LGITLNFVAAILIALPLLAVRQDGRYGFRFRNKEVVNKESGTYMDFNIHLRKALFFSRDCTVAALPFLITGTSLLIMEALQ